MIIIAVFVVLVFFYSLFSRRLEHTVFTAPIVFTSVGIVLPLTLPVQAELETERKTFLLLAEAGLVLTLFSDATRIGLRSLRSNEGLPARLLGIGMLPTIALGAVAAVLVLPGLTVWEAGILAAILAPTDAGLGEVIVRSPSVPVRIRQALNVEAGLNDGLSVPFLMFFIALAAAGTEGAGSVLMRFVVEQLGFGALVGVAFGFAGGWLLGLARRMAWMDENLQQLGLVSIPLVSILGCKPVGASPFIAAFVAGLAVQRGFREAAQSSVAFTEGWGRLLNFFVFFLFGMFVARAWTKFDVPVFMYALLSLTAVRMVPVALSLVGTGMSGATKVFMGWFGPRGLASIVLGLVYLEEESHLAGEPVITLAVMATVIMSIYAHGLSALPGIELYARAVDALGSSSPEKRETADT